MASPNVNVSPADVKVIVVNNHEEVLRTLESEQGQKAVFNMTNRRMLDHGVGS